MSWASLLKQGHVQSHATSINELDELRGVVERDLKDAAIKGLSDDRRYATAYSAVLQLSKMVIACARYRVLAKGSQHQTSFEALELAMGQQVKALSAYFDTCRRKCNKLEYDKAMVVSSTEADELLRRAHEFEKLVESWIAKNFPGYI